MSSITRQDVAFGGSAMPNGEPNPEKIRTAASLAVIGSELVGPALFGVVADQWMGTTPWLTITGTLAGAALAAWHGYVVLSRLENKS